HPKSQALLICPCAAFSAVAASSDVRYSHSPRRSASICRRAPLSVYIERKTASGMLDPVTVTPCPLIKTSGDFPLQLARAAPSDKLSINKLEPLPANSRISNFGMCFDKNPDI